MTTKTLSPYDIKRLYNASSMNGHFFDRDTMAFFGDTMASFETLTLNGQLYMYRKPSATVSVFGVVHRTGREFFSCWLITDDWDINHCDDETKQAVYDAI
jgi:hypothetical protein